MFTGFVGLLKVLWPFIKESILQDGTVRDWLRRNKAFVVILSFQLIMLMVIFWMAETITLLRTSEAEATSKLALVENDKKNLQERYDEKDALYRQEKARADALALQMTQGGLMPAPGSNALAGSSRCDYFHPPQNQGLPPYQSLGPKELTNKDEAIAKLTLHINVMRQYSRTVAQNWENAYTVYVDSCTRGIGAQAAPSNTTPAPVSQNP